MEKTLDELRLFKFSQKIVTSKVAVQPDALGLKSDAASFHLLRVFYQVQVWMGAKDIDPLAWGWIRKCKFLLPISMSKPRLMDCLR